MPGLEFSKPPMLHLIIDCDLPRCMMSHSAAYMVDEVRLAPLGKLATSSLRGNAKCHIMERSSASTSVSTAS